MDCEVMVFNPSLKEFKNFSQYVDHIESVGAHVAGITKIIPPKDWKGPVKSESFSAADEIVIPSPISQTVTGMDGTYQQYSKRKKSMTVKDFRKLAESKYSTPKHSIHEELDEIYWNSITKGDRIYGADVSASLFSNSVKKWNLRSLDTILDCVSNDYGLKIEGVNTTYLYFGMWKTSFPWHTEDCDLYSINYHHYGMRKVWYTIPPAYSKRFEALVKRIYPANYQACEGFLRHKTTIISPDVLKEHGIPFSKVEQNPGEFIITFPNSYHAGYNAGFNCAEAINFASIRWIDYGKKASKCVCRAQNIDIRMDTFVKTFQSDQYESWLNEEDNQKRMENTKKQASRVTLGPKIILTIIRNENGAMSVALPNESKSGANSETLPQESGRETNSLFGKKRKYEAKSKLSCDSESDEDLIDIKKPKNEEDYVPEDYPDRQTWLDSFLMYCKARKEDILVKNIMETWAKPISRLWIFQSRNFEMETKYNRLCSLHPPHCTVCAMINKRCDDKITSRIPPESVPRIPVSMFDSEGMTETNVCKPSQLLVCGTCGVCVHSSCYLEARHLYTKKWLCKRCADQSYAVECCLCCLRSGAFTKTTTGLWVHVVCALIARGRKFLPDGNVALNRIKNISRVCSFCCGLGGHLENFLSGFSTVQCDEANCTETFHVTCAIAAGVHFIPTQNFPFYIKNICLKHSQISDEQLNAKA